MQRNSNNQMRKMRNIRQEDDRILDRKIGIVNNHRRMQEYWTWGRKEIEQRQKNDKFLFRNTGKIIGAKVEHKTCFFSFSLSFG
jgi:hypothetical protein